ncbi:hypothetical protein KKY_272 [Pelagibacterium halotolerans B2]|uniref:Uncharacterized protein n=1 Tax=Pelagibacterium halotolerans (strain DSM 22347 / JCM 15775 / CGMCC 1.7692 / B2) TaxID=1082931 RepID=G4R8N1_PELHB|nr:hypothetical protein KKY_272 [Pelagibacterium halotolerans B2]
MNGCSEAEARRGFFRRSSGHAKCKALCCSLQGRVRKFYNQPEHKWLLGG